jgi:hypothetical protein
MKFGAQRDPPASTVGFFFAPNFNQKSHTVLKNRLWESRSTPTLAGGHVLRQISFKISIQC